MYSAVLSVLLMGMVPAWETGDSLSLPTEHLAVAMPAPAKSTSLLEAMGNSVSASGVLIIDLESAEPLYGRNTGRHRSIGSLAKLMTAVVIVENHELDEIVTVPREATLVEGGQHYVSAGAKYTVGDLLSALLIASANDAAITLADYHSGSEEAFAQEMNRRARTLGLVDTSFTNPVGFDDPRQWSTPRDIAWLAAYAMRLPDISTRMSTPSATISSLDGRKVSLSHTHSLMHRAQSSVIAGKTGTTNGAGECLVSVVEEHSRRYLVVLLHSADRYADMQIVLRALNELRV